MKTLNLASNKIAEKKLHEENVQNAALNLNNQ